MIDLNLPEPAVKECVYCLKSERLTGTLIHWPHEGYSESGVKQPGGLVVEPFSLWLYECAWCRGIETKRRARCARNDQSEASSPTK